MFFPWLIYECTTRLPWHKPTQTWMLDIYVERLGNKFIYIFLYHLSYFLFPFNADIFWRHFNVNNLTNWKISFCDYRAVTDPRDGRRVALKKLPNVFQSLVSSKRVFRELKMLCFFKHENVSWRRVCIYIYVHSRSFYCTYLQFNNKISYNFMHAHMYRSHVPLYKLVNSF